jgi:hypothetical protein
MSINYAPGGKIFSFYHLVPGGKNVLLIDYALGGKKFINV